MRLINEKLLAVKAAASNDPTRYVLNGVHVEEIEGNKVRAVATDGRILAVTEGTAGEPDDFPRVPAIDHAPNGKTAAIIPTDAINKAIRSIPKGKRTLAVIKTAALVMGESAATFVTTDLETATPVTSRVIDGQFPNWRQCMPKTAPVVRSTVSPAYLRAVADMVEKFGADSVEVSLWDSVNPVRFRANNGGDILRVVLMPMKECAPMTTDDGVETWDETPKTVDPTPDPVCPTHNQDMPDGICDGCIEDEDKAEKEAADVPPVVPPVEPPTSGGGEADPNPFADAPIISSYSQAQALEDGFLVDLTKTDEYKEAGFKTKMVCTSAVYELLEGKGLEGQDFNGRLWDMLTILLYAIRTATRKTDRLKFNPLFVMKNGAKPELVDLVAHIGPGDTAEPVITIMFPHED